MWRRNDGPGCPFEWWDAMCEPKIGDKGVCTLCGGDIEYVGPYWRHIGANFQHIAAPAARATTTDDERPYPGCMVIYAG